jgi:uncharacterized RDD family membrane protein YckC
MTPAGLLRRAAAFAVDYVLIAAYIVVVVLAGVLFRAVAPAASEALFANPFLAQLAGFLVLTLPVTLYFALSEASSAGATVGKRRLRIRVLTTDGARLRIGRSLARSALKFVPWELAHGIIWQFSAAGPNPPMVLSIGLAVVWILVGLNLFSALFNARRRTLYDRIAGTVVLQDA